MIVLVNYKQRQEDWFWKAMFLVLVHVVVLFSLKGRLPLPSLGVAILLSVPEAILLPLSIAHRSLFQKRSFANNAGARAARL